MAGRLSRAGREPLVLASSSPRRQEIVRILGLPFVVRAADVDEAALPGEPPETAVQRLAEAKVRWVAAAAAERYVVGADTVVVLGGAILGKPADAGEAAAMLRSLRGREHGVVSGVAALDRVEGRLALGAARTRVWMRGYGDDEIARYAASGEPLDKAGAYAIQDPHFRPVARFEGCYLNVVGLPLCLLLDLLWEVGVEVAPPDPARVRRLCPHCVLQPS